MIVAEILVKAQKVSCFHIFISQATFTIIGQIVVAKKAVDGW